MKTLLKRAEKLLKKSFERIAQKNSWKNMDYGLWNDDEESGSFHDQSYVTNNHDSDYEEYPSEIPYDENTEMAPSEYYLEDEGRQANISSRQHLYDENEPYTRIEQWSQYGDKPYDKKMIEQSYDILQDCLDLLVKYFGNVSLTIRKFHETAVNEELENNDIIQRIEKFLKELYNLDKIIKQYEGESLEHLGRNAVENMDRIMDECKNIFEKIQTLQEILGFEEPMLQSPEMQSLKKVISDIRKINIDAIHKLDNKFEEFDSMDITIPQDIRHEVEENKEQAKKYKDVYLKSRNPLTKPSWQQEFLEKEYNI